MRVAGKDIHISVSLRALREPPRRHGVGGASTTDRPGATGGAARCLLHEIDRLDGILFLDRVDSLARDVFRRKSYRR